MTLFGKMVLPKNQKPRRVTMDFSTLKPWQEVSETGVIYELGSIYARLLKLTDLRKARGKQYSLETILILILLAKLSGQDKPVEIADWAKNNQERLVELLKLKKDKMPHHNTYRRILAHKVYREEIEQLVQEHHAQGKQGYHYGVDGKTVRGTRQANELRGDHLLSVYDIQTGKVLVQMEVESKENEIVVAPQALEKVNLKGKIISADAMHTQQRFSAQVVGAGGNYIFPVKENQPRLYQDIQQLFAPQHPKPGFGKINTDFTKATQVSKGHGRLEIRTITTSEMLNAHISWPGLRQVYCLERQFNWLRDGTCYKQTSEIEYGITSLTRLQATPLQVLQKRRDHWYIETGLHYRRDVTFREDTTRMTIGNMGSVMAAINNLTLALIMQAGFHNAAQGRRWFAGHLDRAFELLTTANPRL
jgi:predicted transposase YbfD/YdcC